MFCEKCGMRVSGDDPFCPRCGNRTKAEESGAHPNPFFAAGDLDGLTAEHRNTVSCEDAASAAPTSGINAGSSLRMSPSLKQESAKREENAACASNGEYPPPRSAPPAHTSAPMPAAETKKDEQKGKKRNRAVLVGAAVVAIVLIGAGILAAIHFFGGDTIEQGKTESLRADTQTDDGMNAVAIENLPVESDVNAASEEYDSDMRFAEKVATLYMHGDYISYAKYTAYDFYAGEIQWYEKLAKDSGGKKTYLEEASDIYQQNFGSIEEVLEYRHSEQEKTLTERFGSYQLDNYVYMPITYSGWDLSKMKSRIETEASAQGLNISDCTAGYDAMDSITVLRVEHKFVGTEIAWNTKYIYLVGQNERKVLWLSKDAPELPLGINWEKPVKISGDSGTDAMLDEETALELAKAYLASHAELTGGAVGWGTSVRTPILINGKYYYRIRYLHPETDEAVYEYYLEIFTGEVYSEDELQ